MTAVTTEVPGPPAGHYGPAGVLRSEWTKFKSVRSTSWSLAATVVLTIAIGILATAVEAQRWNQLSFIERLTFDPVRQSLTGILFSQLAIGVLGVLVVSAEYGTGTIRSTLAAVPNRPLVLGSKAVVFGVVALVISEVLAFAAFFIGQAILSGSTPTTSLSDPAALRAVIGAGLYLTLLGLFALGLGAIIRHTAGAISAFVGVLLVLPLIVQALPQSIIDDVGKFLPANIGVTMVGLHDPPDIRSFSPWVGLGLLALYAAAALAIGGWVMVRRDA